jgi:uncharacterized membrane protein YdjX (TVP38/TMEM64 family)
MDHLLDLRNLLPWLHHLGPWAAVVFVVLQIVQVLVVWIPGTPFEIAGGIAFGIWGGTLLSSIGIALGSLCAFGLARCLGKAGVDNWLSKHDFRLLGRLVHHPRLELMLAAVFFLPFLPKKPFCYLAGLSDVKPFRFLWVTTLAHIPGLMLTSWLGHTAVHGLGKLFWAVMLLGVVFGSVAFLYRKSLLAAVK